MKPSSTSTAGIVAPNQDAERRLLHAAVLELQHLVQLALDHVGEALALAHVVGLRQVPEDELEILRVVGGAGGIGWRSPRRGAGRAAGLAVLRRSGGRGPGVRRLRAQEVGLRAVGAGAQRGVQMDRDEEVRLVLVGDGRGRMSRRHQGVLGAGEHHPDAEALRELCLQLAGEQQRQLLLLDAAGADRSHLDAAMAGIDDDGADARQPLRGSVRCRRHLHRRGAMDVEHQPERLLQHVALGLRALGELEADLPGIDGDALHQRGPGSPSAPAA